MTVADVIFNIAFVVGTIGLPLLAMEAIDRLRERRRSPMRDHAEMRCSLRELTRHG